MISPIGGNWKEMFVAAQKGDVDLVRYHLKMGADPNFQHAEILTTPLIESAENGHLEVVKLLLEMGARPEIRSELDGWNALEIAHKKGHDSVAEFLAEKMGVKLEPLKKDNSFSLKKRFKKWLAS